MTQYLKELRKELISKELKNYVRKNSVEIFLKSLKPNKFFPNKKKKDEKTGGIKL